MEEELALNQPIMPAETMLMIFVATVVTVLFLNFIAHKLQHRRKRGYFLGLFRRRGTKTMGRRAQEYENKRLISNTLTDMLLDRFTKGKMTWEQVTHYSTQFGNILSIPDLLPKGKLTLKQKLRMSVLKRQLKEKHGHKLQPKKPELVVVTGSQPPNDLQLLVAKSLAK